MSGAPQTELGRLIADRLNELGLSYRSAADRSGGAVSHATLNALVLGRGNVSRRLNDRTLVGIATALDLPLSDVRAAAGVTADEPMEFVLPPAAARLSSRGRAAILAMLAALLEAEERAAQDDDTVSQGSSTHQA
jgi:transcriptional regulator with XRE-family HTH domain